MFGIERLKQHKVNGDQSLVILGGNSNPELVQELAELLGIAPADVLVGKFPEGEIQVQIRENIRGKDIFIVQSTCTPPNENLMELLYIALYII